MTEDTGSAKEHLSSDNNETDKTANHTLFNSFLLNEIKAQDDAIRQVTSISGLLIGAYTTVIVNSIGKLPTSLQNNTIWTHFPNTTQGLTGSEVQNYYYSFYFVLLLPLVFWIYGLIISVMNLSPSFKKWPYKGSPRDNNQQLDENLVVAFLMTTAESKYRKYKLSSSMMVMGLMVALIIAMLSILRT